MNKKSVLNKLQVLHRDVRTGDGAELRELDEDAAGLADAHDFPLHAGQGAEANADLGACGELGQVGQEDGLVTGGLADADKVVHLLGRNDEGLAGDPIPDEAGHGTVALGEEVFVEGLLVGVGEDEVVDGGDVAVDDAAALFLAQALHGHEGPDPPSFEDLLRLELPGIGNPKRIPVYVSVLRQRFLYMSS